MLPGGESNPAPPTLFKSCLYLLEAHGELGVALHPGHYIFRCSWGRRTCTYPLSLRRIALCPYYKGLISSNESPYYTVLLQAMSSIHPVPYAYSIEEVRLPWSPVSASLFCPGLARLRCQYCQSTFTTPVSCYRTSLPCIRSPRFC